MVLDPSSLTQGQAPWVVFAAIILTALATWVVQERRHGQEQSEKDSAAKFEHETAVEKQRDELTFQLLQNARLEMSAARIEVEDLREEVRKLRSMENHFYYFQQSLDHLEALLFPGSDEERATAERNAKAFLVRMKRLNEAKGTIANESQRAASAVHLLGDDPVVKPTGKDEQK